MLIAQILLSPRIGGAESLVESLSYEWDRLGHASEVVYLDPETVKRGRWSRLRNLRDSLRALQPDLVLAHSYLPGLYARLAWGHPGPVHVVLHSAGDDFAHPQSVALERLLAARTASVIAVSERQLDSYRSRFGGRVRSTVISNGVSDRIKPRLALRSTPRRIITVARVAPQKRPDFWAEVARDFTKSHPDIIMEWWGPLSGTAELDAFVLEPGAQSASYKGPTDDVAAAFESADIMFHPSGREAASIALLEGAVSGLPIVYADSIDRPSPEDVWALRYESHSPQAAADALRDVVTNWQDRGGDALEYASAASDRFGMPSVAAAYLGWMTAQRS